MCAYFLNLEQVKSKWTHLKVIFVPYMVQMGCFLGFFAQSQQKKRYLPAISSSIYYQLWPLLRRQSHLSYVNQYVIQSRLEDHQGWVLYPSQAARGV